MRKSYYCPFDEQRNIVVYLDGVQARLASLRELQSAAGEELSALLPSVLRLSGVGVQGRIVPPIPSFPQIQSAEADAIEAEFQELVLGYDRVLIESSKAEEMFEGRSLPAITNNEQIVSGEEIKPYINELEKFVKDWRLFQGDFVM
jgi:hypothetical protein